MAFEDKTLTCRDCSSAFTWTAGEQDFYQQKGFDNPPSRCPDCRAKRKAEFRGNRSREMHTATCANCGKEAQVPFNPRGDRPVYCAECYKTMRDVKKTEPKPIKETTSEE